LGINLIDSSLLYICKNVLEKQNCKKFIGRRTVHIYYRKIISSVAGLGNPCFLRSRKYLKRKSYCFWRPVNSPLIKSDCLQLNWSTYLLTNFKTSKPHYYLTKTIENNAVKYFHCFPSFKHFSDKPLGWLFPEAL